MTTGREDLMAIATALQLAVDFPAEVLAEAEAWVKNPCVDDYMPLEMIGLYWHFVDIVWIFLFPLMYLIS